MNYCHWAKSLGALEDTAENVWGTEKYILWKHLKEPTVFFGMYDVRDYLALSIHRGKSWVLWAGGDIKNLIRGFSLNDGKLKWFGKFLPLTWWLKHMLCKAEHWVENDYEADKLASFGLDRKRIYVCPSFLGDIDFPITYEWNKTMNVYVSSGADRQEEYGFGIVERIAGKLPFIKFHLFGAEWTTKQENVIVHGRISKELMNFRTSYMQVGLRLNEFDGFSEILAKAVLRGQYAIGKVKHPMIPSFENDMDLILKLNTLRHKTEPNLEGREYYKLALNKYPWYDKENER